MIGTKNNYSNAFFVLVITSLGFVNLFLSLCVSVFYTENNDILTWPCQYVVILHNALFNEPNISVKEMNEQCVVDYLDQLGITYEIMTRQFNNNIHSIFIKTNVDAFDEITHLLSLNGLLFDSEVVTSCKSQLFFYSILVLTIILYIVHTIIKILYVTCLLDLVKLMSINGINYKCPLNFMHKAIHSYLIYSYIISTIMSFIGYIGVVCYFGDIHPLNFTMLYEYIKQNDSTFLLLSYVLDLIKFFIDICILNVIILIFKISVKDFS